MSLDRSVRRLLGLLIVGLLVALVALPALAAAPSGTPTGSPAAAASEAPAGSEAPEASKRPKPADKAPGVEVTVTGTVATRTDADGKTEYTLTAGGTTHILDAGPAWFFKDDNPLKPFVGKRVTIVGEQRAGDTELEVETVDGTRLREPGKPLWAGGWKRVGEDHPGWTQEKWDRWQARLQRLGADCFPPGQCKDKSAKKDKAARDDAAASPTP